MRFKVDYFMLAILCSVGFASIFPATGIAVPGLRWATVGAIALLFFLYGARLEPRQALAGLLHWRLHLTILAFTFVLFPTLGVVIQHVVSAWLPAGLAIGLVYTCLVPSTVQSSITFTSIAGGNVSGAIVSATISNLLGIVITPVLAISLLSSVEPMGSSSLSWTAIGDISAQILAPFILGQASRPWAASFVKAHPRLKLLDQFSIVLVVYSAFSAGIRDGIWHSLTLNSFAIVVVICLLTLISALWGTKTIARVLGFDLSDQIAIQFCGTKKSLATGLPMAMVLFPPPQLGLIVVPLMVFHMIQLLACSMLAANYARNRAGN